MKVRHLLLVVATAATMMSGPGMAQDESKRMQPRERDANAQRAMQDKRTGDQPSRAQKNSQGERTIIGKVTDTIDVELEGVAGDFHRLVKVENQKGKTMVVDLGMIGNLYELRLSRGDRLIAIGKNARINDRPVLFAKYAGKLYATGRTGAMGSEES